MQFHHITTCLVFNLLLGFHFMSANSSSVPVVTSTGPYGPKSKLDATSSQSWNHSILQPIDQRKAPWHHCLGNELAQPSCVESDPAEKEGLDDAFLQNVWDRDMDTCLGMCWTTV